MPRSEHNCGLISSIQRRSNSSASTPQSSNALAEDTSTVTNSEYNAKVLGDTLRKLVTPSGGRELADKVIQGNKDLHMAKKELKSFLRNLRVAEAATKASPWRIVKNWPVSTFKADVRLDGNAIHVGSQKMQVYHQV